MTKRITASNLSEQPAGMRAKISKALEDEARGKLMRGPVVKYGVDPAFIAEAESSIAIDSGPGAMVTHSDMGSRYETVRPTEAEIAVFRKPREKPVNAPLAPNAGVSPRKKGKARQSSKKARVGALCFDSETEARCYEQDRAAHKAVFVHPKIALGSGENETVLIADSIVCLETYSDGTFRAKLTDVKGFRKKWNSSHTEYKLIPIVMDDAAVKKKWFQDTTGIRLFIRDDKGHKA